MEASQSSTFSKFGSRANKYIVRFKQKPSTEKRLWLIVLILTIFLFILFIFHLSHWRKRREEICTTKQCVTTASQVLELIDFEKNPCDDFFAFACGRWTELFKENSQFARLTYKNYREVRELMKKPLPEDSPKPVKDAQILLLSCLNQELRDELGMRPILEILQILNLPTTLPSNDTIDEFNLGDTIMKIRRITNIEMFFTTYFADIEPEESGLDKSVIGLVFKPSNYLKSAKKQYPQWTKSLVKRSKETEEPTLKTTKGSLILERQDYFESIIKELIKNNENYSNYDMNDIKNAAIRILITKLKFPMAEDEENDTPIRTNYTKTNLNEINSLLNDDRLEPSDPKYINLTSYILNYYGELVSADYNESEVVFIKNIEYFDELKLYLSSANSISIQRLVWWNIIESFMMHTSTKVRFIRANFYHHLGYNQNPEPIEDQCSNVITQFYQYAIGYRISTDPQVIQRINEVKKLFENLRKAFKRMVNLASWIDRPTKTKAIEKVDKMKSYIGMPSFVYDKEEMEKKLPEVEFSKDVHFLTLMIEYYKAENEKKFPLENLNSTYPTQNQRVNFLFKKTNDEDEDTTWKENQIFEVNALYNPSGNNIQIPLGILKHPFFEISVESYNYGAFGTILGHEITHGFDDTGKDYDSNGNNVPWWSHDMEKLYNERASCFINQYNDKKINGTVKLSENIADNGGIREAFWAYKWQRQPSTPQPKLPGLEYFSSEQLFFLGFANLWCSEPITEEDLTDPDEHSPKTIRVQATLENFDEFSKAWNCPLGSRMNPLKKCILW